MKTALFILTLLTSLLGCKDSPPPDCGCGSETLGTVQLATGTISYKTQMDSQDDYYIDTFWITVGSDTLWTHFIVCNEDMVTSSFPDIKSSIYEQETQVSFSGEIKDLCRKRTDISNVSYTRILLTSIEKP